MTCVVMLLALTTAEKIAKAMSAVYDEIQLPYEIHVSKVNSEGISII